MLQMMVENGFLLRKGRREEIAALLEGEEYKRKNKDDIVKKTYEEKPRGRNKRS
jgi:hypothetical protein